MPDGPREFAMQFAQDFWAALNHLSSHIEHTPGSAEDRRQKIVAAYHAFGPLGRQTVLEELQTAIVELAEIERRISLDGDGKKGD
jgi:Ser/Thr protein kinase RdoA (MazF antagonist)